MKSHRSDLRLEELEKFGRSKCGFQGLCLPIYEVRYWCLFPAGSYKDHLIKCLQNSPAPITIRIQNYHHEGLSYSPSL